MKLKAISNRPPKVSKATLSVNLCRAETNGTTEWATEQRKQHSTGKKQMETALVPTDHTITFKDFRKQDIYIGQCWRRQHNGIMTL
ncbi:hypothetical protein M514_04947, partial [Trichuris suis]